MQATLRYEPFDMTCRDQALELYARLRDEAPIYRTESGVWVISRYSDVRKVFTSPDKFSSSAQQSEGIGLPTKLDENADPALIAQLLAVVADMPVDPMELFTARAVVAADPPQHTRIRKIVNRGFTPRRISAMKEQVQWTVDACLDGIENATEYDVVERLSVPLPVQVISDLLSIEPEHYVDVKRWTDQLAHSQMGENRGSPETLGEMMGMFREFAHYLIPRLEARRANPTDDLLSDLVRATESDTLSDTEAVLFVFSLMAAGNETTTSAIGHTIVSLLQNPDQLELLIARPELIPNAVEESLRYSAPLQFLWREALEDVEMEGTTIPAGAPMIILVGAANHDPDQFPDPDRFDITRDNLTSSLAFGHGIHFCIGAHLGRLELHLAMEKLLPHLPDFEIEGEVRLSPSLMFYGHDRITLRRTSARSLDALR